MTNLAADQGVDTAGPGELGEVLGEGLEALLAPLFGLLFFLAGRRMPWWAAALSIFGTQLSAITFMAIPSAGHEAAVSPTEAARSYFDAMARQDLDAAEEIAGRAIVVDELDGVAVRRIEPSEAAEYFRARPALVELLDRAFRF